MLSLKYVQGVSQAILVSASTILGAMEMLPAAGAIMSSVLPDRDITISDILRCTEALAERLAPGQPVPREQIQEAAGRAGLFRTSFTEFSLDVLPCIWSDIRLVDLSHDQWKQTLRLVNRFQQESSGPPCKLQRSNSVSSSYIASRASSREQFERMDQIPAVSSSSIQACSDRSVDVSCSGSKRGSQSSQSDDVEMRSQLRDQQQQIQLLRSVVATTQRDLSEAKLKLKNAQRANRRLEDQLAASQEELKEERAQKLHDFAISRTSDMYKNRNRRANTKNDDPEDETHNWEWLTPQGSQALGIRKNFSHISTSDIGITLCDDVSRWTVARMEVRVGACMIADAWNFFRAWRVAACTEKPVDLEPVTIISFRQDGTNSGIFNKSKLITLELEACYRLDIPASSNDPGRDHSASYVADDLFQSWQKLKRLSDVQIVKSGTGLATLALTEKMLDSLCCPHWGNVCNEPGSDAEQRNSLQYKWLNCNWVLAMTFCKRQWLHLVEFSMTFV